MAFRFSGRTSSGVWLRCATVSVRLCVSNLSPGLLHCLPQTSHFQPTAFFLSSAIFSQFAGYLALSIGIVILPAACAALPAGQPVPSNALPVSVEDL